MVKRIFQVHSWSDNNVLKVVVEEDEVTGDKRLAISSKKKNAVSIIDKGLFKIIKKTMED